MKLYGIDPLRIREHVIGAGTTISGLALGTEGPGQSQFIVTMRQFEFAPHPKGWHVVPSVNGFPQIQANEIPVFSSGWLAYFSAFQPPGGKAVGRILVSSANLNEIVVVGRGLGGNGQGVLWDEALLAITPAEGVEVLMLMTHRPDRLYRFTTESVVVTALFDPRGEDEFLRITDPQVPRWRRFRHKEE